MKEYNGHRSWNAWNVCLWLHNDPDWYSEWEWMSEYPEIKLAIEENWSK